MNPQSQPDVLGALLTTIGTAIIGGFITGTMVLILEYRSPWFRLHQGTLAGWDTRRRIEIILYFISKYTIWFLAVVILYERRDAIITSMLDYIIGIMVLIATWCAIRALNMMGHPRESPRA